MSDPDLSDIRLQRAIAAASDERTLRSRLDDIVKRKGLRDVSVGVLVKGRALTLVASGAGAPTDGGGDARSPGDAAVTAGCLAKLLTTSLMSEAVAAGHVSWGDLATDVLPCGARGRQLLTGITIRHLLDHSHGLDASVIGVVPYTADGFIDVEALCGEIDPQPLSSPGQMYSYCHVGAWLAGAALESIHGIRYGSQLCQRQLVAIDPSREVARVCPATGADLTLTVSEWLSFAERCVGQLQQTGGALPEQTKLPGWHPNERSIWRGWKHYGEGWLGHNANLPECSAILRINAREELAIILSAHKASGAAFAAAGIFGELLPEFRSLRPPRLLKPELTSALRLNQHIGRYKQARATVEITMDADGALRLGIIERTSDRKSPPPCRLRPAEGGVFLAESGGGAEFLFVQFIADETSAASAYLWNGRQLWRREAQ
jgi:hypothetical protein